MCIIYSFIDLYIDEIEICVVILVALDYKRVNGFDHHGKENENDRNFNNNNNSLRQGLNKRNEYQGSLSG